MLRGNLCRIAIDASGNAMAVLDQFDGTRSKIWANRYRQWRRYWKHLYLAALPLLPV
jgi:hypothetical protein